MTIPDLPPGTALFLDLDGTLLDIAPRHDLVWVAPELPEVLTSLRASLGGALAIVSGRPLHDIVSFIPIDGLCAAAEHGARILLPDGAIEADTGGLIWRDDWIARIKTALPRWPGAFLEEKTVGLVIHFRQAPVYAAEIEAFMRALIVQAEGEAELLPALMAFEIRRRGVGKGHVVRRLMRASPFHGRIPIFIGDDVTDEEGMEAAEEFGGYGLHVARVFGGEPAQVRAWLAVQAAHLRAAPPSEG
jgi:trehalose 6-phosphate phosphatase